MRRWIYLLLGTATGLAIRLVVGPDSHAAIVSGLALLMIVAANYLQYLFFLYGNKK